MGSLRLQNLDYTTWRSTRTTRAPMAFHPAEQDYDAWNLRSKTLRTRRPKATLDHRTTASTSDDHHLLQYHLLDKTYVRHRVHRENRSYLNHIRTQGLWIPGIALLENTLTMAHYSRRTSGTTTRLAYINTHLSYRQTDRWTIRLAPDPGMNTATTTPQLRRLRALRKIRLLSRRILNATYHRPVKSDHI